MLNNIPLYEDATFCLSNHPLIDTGYLYLLDIMSNAAMNIG